MGFWGFGLTAWSFGFRGWGFRTYSLGFRVWEFGSEAEGLRHALKACVERVQGTLRG